MSLRDRSTLNIRAPGVREDIPVAWNNLGPARDGFIKKLEGVRGKLAADVAPAWEAVTWAFRELREESKNFFVRLCRGDWMRVSRAFRAAIPDSGKRASSIAVVEANVADQVIPFEALSVFELDGDPKITCHAELEAAARRFLGFSAVVRHKFPSLKVTRLQPESRIRAEVFVNDHFEGAVREWDYLTRNASFEASRFSTPETDEQAFARQVARRLATATVAGNGPHVHHFAGHSLTTIGGNEDDYALEVTDRFHRPVHVTLRDLRVAAPESRGTRPLVFLNSCGSGRLASGVLTSFPEFFLSSGSAGFVGTEVLVPDRIASSFSQKFFEELGRGAPVGIALFQARLAVLRRFRSVLGLVFVSYTEPSLRLFKAPPRVAPP